LGSARLDFLLRRRIYALWRQYVVPRSHRWRAPPDFDAGTGMRPLGLELARQAPIDIDIYFTHTHLDHIIGLTFFAPLFEKRNSVRLWAGHLQAPMPSRRW
jgi:glyoxylase-like metal-dependent hydrolase (beta-lactamase superfamily II)